MDTQNYLQTPDKDHLSSAVSSRENSTLSLNQHQSPPSVRLNDIPENANSYTRRPSFLLDVQEMITNRRPSAIMASLRRGSQSILNGFRTKNEDPNDHVGFKSPEAVESRRKNRRYGE